MQYCEHANTEERKSTRSIRNVDIAAYNRCCKWAGQNLSKIN